MALLVGYGAGAVNPYVALESITALCRERALPGDPTPAAAHAKYIKALKKGVLKIMSKMGISTISSYQGAQIFEALGIDQFVIDKYFTGTASRIRGVGTGADRRRGARAARARVRPQPRRRPRRRRTLALPRRRGGPPVEPPDHRRIAERPRASTTPRVTPSSPGAGQRGGRSADQPAGALGPRAGRARPCRSRTQSPRARS